MASVVAQAVIGGLVSKIWEMFLEELAHPAWDIGNYMRVVTKVMEIVDTVSDLTGSEKKGLVLDTIDKYVSESDDSLLKAILSRATVSNLIETVISASKGLLKLKASGKKLTKNCYLTAFQSCGKGGTSGPK